MPGPIQSKNMIGPFLSEFDPAKTSEGSLDPLGLYSIADRLATKLVPGFRERMRHPRFLTSIAAGAHICSEYDEDAVAKDGVSPPYQVFEWYVVQALVRDFKDNLEEITGLPGRDKAFDAMKKDIPLCAENYLKTAFVFGFHGVYRTLAENLGVTQDGRLGEAGDRLLRVWESEQDLKGFYTRKEGPGSNLLRAMRSAVKDGMESGKVMRKWNWGENSEIAKKFAIYKAGSSEKDQLLGLLNLDQSTTRSQVIEFLSSNSGSEEWLREGMERDFHDALLKKATGELKVLLECIQAYERFARLAQDAFDDCLFYMSQKKNRTSLTELEGLPAVKKAKKELPKTLPEVLEQLSMFGYSDDFVHSFDDIDARNGGKYWAEQLINHHLRIQKNKPPLGKNPWFDRFDDNTFYIRPMYCRDRQPDPNNNSYVHYYRTRPLWDFLKDLGKVENG